MRADKIALLFFVGFFFAAIGLQGTSAASYNDYYSNYYTHYLPSYGWNGFINYEYSYRPYYTSSYYYRPAYYTAVLPQYYGAYYGNTLYRGYNHYNHYRYTPVNYLYYANNYYHFYPKPAYHPSYYWAW